jgi:hypothetical protein
MLVGIYSLETPDQELRDSQEKHTALLAYHRRASAKVTWVAKGENSLYGEVRYFVHPIA